MKNGWQLRQPFSRERNIYVNDNIGMVSRSPTTVNKYLSAVVVFFLQ